MEYLGWRFALGENGAVTRRLKKQSKLRWKHRLRKMKALYENGKADAGKVHESTQSYRNHVSYGNTYRMYNGVMKKYVLVRKNTGGTGSAPGGA